LRKVIDLEAEVVLNKVLPKGTDFPRFENGIVFIEIIKLHKVYSYAFDPKLLEKASPVFKKTLRSPIYEADKFQAEYLKSYTRYWFRYELLYSWDDDLWVLRRAVSSSSTQQMECSHSLLIQTTHIAAAFYEAKGAGSNPGREK
jgi:hypothetical protein